jgi:PAS domain S-box-containing protein
VRRVLTDGRVTNYELMIRARDSAETLVSYNATTFTGADGQLRGVFAAARHNTDQTRLEEQIRQQNRELTETTTFMNSVMESATESSIIAMDREGLILAWNEGARRNYGYSADEIVGKANARILNAPEAAVSSKVQELFDTADRTGKAEGVVERVRKNGERFPASVAKTLRRDADGTPIGYVLISKDITEQKRLEAQIQRTNEELEQQARRVQEANRMKSEFLANMSHELRTPLNGIIGFSELMYDGKVGALAAQHQEYLALILKSSRHLLQLVNDVLDLAKVESGKFEFVPEPVDLPKLLGEVTGVQQSVAAQTRVRVEVDVAADLDQVVVDPAKLKQVIYNYLSNAIKFSPEGGRVRIRVAAEEPDLFRIEVEDTGIGIKPEDIDRLFVEFQQLDASAAKKHQGTGLGLALTKRIVEAQGGQVGVRSELGTGSTFFAVLPRVTYPSAGALPPTPQPMTVPRSNSRPPAKRSLAAAPHKEQRNGR